MAKNIVVLCDGTGQIGGEGASTNVYKLFNMLEDRTPNQVVYYDAGIGTSRWKYIHQITGYGFKRNMLDCYRFIFDHYQAGDRIYLFGFSRGAATVRSLSGFIEMFGILPQSRKDLINKAFRIYKIKTPGHEDQSGIAHDKKTELNAREKAAKEFTDMHHTMWTRIRFMGVWDTVAALGFGGKFFDALIDRLWPHKFHNYNLSPGVDFARHALSIDDERKTFHPIIWAALPPGQPEGRLKQVWFCGVHTDVGGGYPEMELSHYSLKWMVDEVTDKGLLIHKDSKEWARFEKMEHNIDAQMHDELGAWWKRRIYARAKRSWPAHGGTICLHKSVLERKKNSQNGEDPTYRPWVFEIKDRHIEG